MCRHLRSNTPAEKVETILKDFFFSEIYLLSFHDKRYKELSEVEVAKFCTPAEKEETILKDFFFFRNISI